jgi:hypothetical protein
MHIFEHVYVNNHIFASIDIKFITESNKINKKS